MPYLLNFIKYFFPFRFEKRIYIPLPEAPARQHMFNLHIGSTPHSIQEHEFKELSKVSDGFVLEQISISIIFKIFIKMYRVY